MIAGEEDGRRRWSEREENEMVWWPPEPVLELARLALDSAGDPDAIYRALDPTVIPVSSKEPPTPHYSSLLQKDPDLGVL